MSTVNTVVTSAEAILQSSRELACSRGWAAVSIRSVAAACGVSAGSIYHYFDSKADLVSATVESVWREIFQNPQEAAVLCDTQAYIAWIYARMEQGSRRYPGFFTLHALGFVQQEEREGGRRRMHLAWQHIQAGLCAVLARDARIRPGAFAGSFTAQAFAGVLFSLMLSALLRQDYNPAAVLEIVRRTLYPSPQPEGKEERKE